MVHTFWMNETVESSSLRAVKMCYIDPLNCPLAGKKTQNTLMDIFFFYQQLNLKGFLIDTDVSFKQNTHTRENVSFRELRRVADTFWKSGLF